VKAAARPTAIDLFCGGGGLSLGLRDAGFTVLVGADNDPFSVETHTGNLGGLGWTGDLEIRPSFSMISSSGGSAPWRRLAATRGAGSMCTGQEQAERAARRAKMPTPKRSSAS
jgi:C-5 cytosine-specific DNA methylase